MTNQAVLLKGGNPGQFTLLRRFLSMHYLLCTLFAVGVVVVFTEYMIMPSTYIAWHVSIRLFVYLCVIGAVLIAAVVQYTLRSWGRVIVSVRKLVDVHGGQRAVTVIMRKYVRDSLRFRKSSRLDITYPLIRVLIVRAGYALPQNYASLLRHVG
jgi:hypothetical protein